MKIPSLRSQLPNRRFFIRVPASVSLPFTVTMLDPGSVDHARKVLRMKPGDPVLGIDPVTHLAYQASIISLSNDSLVLELTQLIDLPSDPLPLGWLGVAMIKEQRWDWLLQKATELGLGKLTPLSTERTMVHLGEPAKKQQRWQSIVQAAASQSEGLFIPPVALPETLASFLEAVQTVPHKWLLQEDGEDRLPLRQAIEQLKVTQTTGAYDYSWTAVIGPEGGWSATERQQIVAAGFTPVALGQRILKTETTVMALLSAVMLL